MNSGIEKTVFKLKHKFSSKKCYNRRWSFVVPKGIYKHHQIYNTRVYADRFWISLRNVCLQNSLTKSFGFCSENVIVVRISVKIRKNKFQQLQAQITQKQPSNLDINWLTHKKYETVSKIR